jgi:hypothetical protein
MSIEMFIVGAVLFALYLYFTIWNIMHNNKRQVEDNKSTGDDMVFDEVDSDGMGNFSRFPQEKD